MVAKVGYQELGEDVGTSGKAGGEGQRGNLKEVGTPRLETSEGTHCTGRPGARSVPALVTILRARPGRVLCNRSIAPRHQHEAVRR
jgi:hypothetical protein